jgi:hypothetical protein
MRIAHKVYLGKGNDYWGDLSVDGRPIYKWTLKKHFRAWDGSLRVTIGSNVGLLQV